MRYKLISEQLNFLRDVMFKYVGAYVSKESEFDFTKEYSEIKFNIPVFEGDVDVNDSYDINLIDVIFKILEYPRHIIFKEFDQERNKYKNLSVSDTEKKLQNTNVLSSCLSDYKGECPLPLRLDIIYKGTVLIDSLEFNSYSTPFYLFLYKYFTLKKRLNSMVNNHTLVGEFNNGVTDYLIVFEQKKYYKLWYLYSKYHKKDMVNLAQNKPLEYPVLNSVHDLIANKHITKSSMTVIDKTGESVVKSVKHNEYLIGCIKQHNTGKSEYFGQLRILNQVLDFYNVGRSYAFTKNSIIESSKYIDDIGMVSITFKASDSYLTYNYDKSGDYFLSYYLSDNSRTLNLHTEIDKISTGIAISLEEVPVNQLQAEIKDIDFDLLKMKMDLSWYINPDGTYKKEYLTIGTKYDLEHYIIGGIIDEYKTCVAQGKKLILSMDTETDGLNIYNLSPNNPYKNKCCAIPIAFKDNQSFVIFTDMEYFDNIPNEVAWSRLKPLFERHLSDNSKNIFTLSVNSDIVGYDKSCVIDRNNIILVGHNVMFDGKVAYDNGVSPEWDEDTLQMAFNINPTIIKGNIGLKNLEWKLLNIEAPELVDILGKGNADKYRLLRDIEVAKIYGCADADGTREVYKKLLEIMPKDMYNSYKKGDIPILNRLYVSEYNGLRVEEDKVKILADNCKKDLTNIEEYLYEYIGRCLYLKECKTVLRNALDTSTITTEQYTQCLKEIDLTKAKPYIFEMKNSSYQTIMYNILKYPIYGYTKDGKPSVDKKVRKILKGVKGRPFLKFDKDFPVYDDKGKSILPKEKLNEVKYPLALIIDEYNTLNKEYTSYFKPIIENNLEGKMFKGYSLTRIETRRIMNPLQTMKGSLKNLTVAYSDDYYLVDFDMSQVEYRIMVALSNFKAMIEKMKDSEKDYHTETAALVHAIEAYLVSKTLRKKTKNISFGIPYGLGLLSLCINMFSDSTPSHKYETAKLLEQFKANNKPVIDLIEGFRDNALREWIMPDNIREYIGAYTVDDFGNKHAIKYGRVVNGQGFHRLFDLTGTNIRPKKPGETPHKVTDSGLVLEGDQSRIGVIRRAAGNYPIQSTAADKFREILINFYNRCEKEGIADKCLWHMLIHDELLLSVHKSVNPFLIFKIILEECMLPIEPGGEPFYFCGINLGKNWGECKDDANEAPVKFVQRIVKRYDAGEFDGIEWFDDAKGFVDKYRKEFLIDRIGEVFREIQPDIDTAPIQFEKILKGITNYTVRAYLMDFFVPPVSAKRYKELSADAQFFLNLEYWAYQKYGADKPIFIEGKLVPTRVRKDLDIGAINLGNKDEDLEVSRDELIDDEYWEDTTVLNVELEEGFVFDEEAEMFSSKTNINELITFTKYQRKYVSKINDIIYVKVPLSNKRSVERLLKNHLDMEGKVIYLGTATGIKTKIGKLSNNINLDDLDKEIGGLISNG